ncbi:hypothetical protein ACSZNV_02365 [Aeromonas hydrophila]|uniref:hypothetical protein n=1 Tax=Aeromonas hydrophila TaxID=644 RepID=UPI001CC3B927|nr:hypothetical protein [Aeromonas hydrophila]GJC04111.1 hypothetical protein KAM385_11400 [Aeromonas hydrophila]
MLFSAAISEVVVLNENLFLPFLATLGASLTVLFIQFNARRVKESKQKVYAVSYVFHQCHNILFSELSIMKATVIPHIKAIVRILENDNELLTKMFLSDEFDILKAPSPEANHLPNDYMLLLGYDDINLSSSYETLQYLESSDLERQELNEFVKSKLKNMNAFFKLTEDEKVDILHEYYDRLISIEHASNRKVFFIVYFLLPQFSAYAKSYQFLLYSKKNINREKSKIQKVLADYKDFVPSTDFGSQTMNGGIQKEIT